MTAANCLQLDAAEASATRISSNLPEKLEVAALAVREKAPFLAMQLREALIWRIEELGRNACEALRREDFATAILLTRAATETSAVMWRLRQLIERRQELTDDALYELLTRMNLGDVTPVSHPAITRVRG
jgi:hypothetical protein